MRSKIIYWSNATLILYLIVTLIFALSLRKARYSDWRFTTRKSGFSGSYILAFLVFWVLATFRSTDNGLGGTDIHSYIETFKNINNERISIDNLFTQGVSEPLFLLITKGIHTISANPVFYLGVLYGLITISYLVFIKVYAPVNISYIPLIMAIFPYLKSFNTVRSSVAISFILLGLAIFKYKKIPGAVLIALSFFIHISAVLYIPFLLFYYLYKNKFKTMDRLRVVGLLLVYIIVIIVITKTFKTFFQSSLLTGAYSYYANMSKRTTFISRLPMYIAQITLGVAIVISYTGITKKSLMEGDESNTDFIRACCIYDIILIPAAYLLGIWRANEFFYIARLLMWGKIINYYCNRSKDSDVYIFIKAFAFVFTLFWLYFRISHEYYDVGIMPYKFL